MPQCIDLVQHFGNIYRITWDEAYDPKGIPRHKRDPWMAQIPCQYGYIYPHSADRFAVEVDYHPNISRQLWKIEGAICTQCGDHELTFTFPLSAFNQVAEVVQPQKRRILTEEQKQSLIERTARHRFTAGRKVGQTAPKIDSEPTI